MIKAGFEPVLASDGAALKVLKEAFSTLKSYELPGYHITYSKSSWSFKLQLLFSFFRIRKVVKAEHRLVQETVEKEGISGIISDNRFGVYHSKIPSVYITHQLTVLSGVFTKFTTKIHRQIIEKFNECWIPDVESSVFSGELSQNTGIKIPVRYVGVLSRLEAKPSDSKYDVAIVLSGPEPQRTFLEQKILTEFNDTIGKVKLVRGILTESQLAHNFQHMEVVNYANQRELNAILNSSKAVIARSGYSSVMDFAVLGKKALFIPTPGQTEQEYLAKRMHDLKIAPYVNQRKFKFSDVKKIESYKGFEGQKVAFDLKLFSLFHGE